MHSQFFLTHNRKYFILSRKDASQPASPRASGAEAQLHIAFSWAKGKVWPSGIQTGKRKSVINLSLISLALLVATALIAGFFSYVHNLKRQAYLLSWTAGWSLLALHYLGSAISGSSGPTNSQRAIDQGLFAGAGILFFLGARLYAHRKVPLPALIATSALILFWTVTNAIGIMPLPVTFASAVIYGFAGFEFWVESRRQETLADWLLAIVFFGWAAIGPLFLFFQKALSHFNLSLEPLSALPTLFAAMLMVMALYE